MDAKPPTLRVPPPISNKIKRSEVQARFKREKRKFKEEGRKKRRLEREMLGDEAPPVPVARTLDNTREHDDTVVGARDSDEEEVGKDEETDEFANYFSGEKEPKLMLTTKQFPSRKIFALMKEIMDMIPNAFYYKRGDFDIKDIVSMATKRGFTHLVVLNEKAKKCNSWMVTHLPEGPTALFKFTSQTLTHDIKGHGRVSGHIPEIILHNFTTRLGHRVGRFLGSLFPHNPEFVGRRVVTFHNQRDYIFVRQHRYQFAEDGKKAKLQELGPRFTLKLKWLQAGTFDTKSGEYEWIHKRHEMDTSRRRFHM